MKDLAPACPHTTKAGRPTCDQPMVEVGDGVWECPNDHSKPRVKPRAAVSFPDLPRYEPGGVIR